MLYFKLRKFILSSNFQFPNLMYTKRILKLYLRLCISEGAIVKTRFTSHTQWVVSVRWSTVDEHLFISGAYDNIIKFWDTRR